AIRIEDHDVGVASDRDRSFAWIKPKQLGRCCRHNLHKAVHAEAPRRGTSTVYQAEAMLDAGTAVGDLRKIISAQFLLVLEAERAMVGGDHLQMVVLQSL